LHKNPIGGQFAAGIGNGHEGSYGAITITKGVSQLKANKGEYAACNSIDGASVTIEDNSKVTQN